MTTQFQDKTTLRPINSTQFIHRVIFNWQLPYHSSVITLTNDSAEQSVGSRQLSLFEPIQEHFPGFSMRITLRTKRNCTIWLLTAVRWDFNNTMEGQNTSVPNVLVQGPKQQCSLSQETKLNTKASPSTKSHIAALSPIAHFQHEHSTNIKLT